MFGNPSLMTRVAVGKLAGLVVGLIGFVGMPFIYPEGGWLLRWGVLLWYVTFGAIIGMCGVWRYHPVLRMPLPWWLRDSLLGAWLNFVLVFFAYASMSALLSHLFGSASILSSPFWFVLEGALIGLLIGYLARRFGGEGAATVTREVTG